MNIHRFIIITDLQINPIGKNYIRSFADFLKERTELIKRQFGTRKRKRNVHLWKRNKNKIARNVGLTYFTYKPMPAKKPNLMNVLCNEKCRRNCSNRISIDQRQSLFTAYYSLDLNGKNVMLFNCIQRRSVKHHRKNAVKRKQNSFYYSVKLPNQNDQIIVCKTAFCSLFQISTKKVEIIQKKHTAGQIVPSDDKRGKHINRANKTSDEVINEIIDHISSFPAESSHYSRNRNPNKKYLAPTLSISQMHRLYIEQCESKELPQQYFIKYGVYANIFSNNFNLSFGQPRSDTCAKCDANEADEEHKIKYKMAFEQQKVDRAQAKSKENVVYLTIDLQQVMQLPKLTTSRAFYLRQLAFYNLGIHSISSSGVKPFMMTWTENIAKRGSDEVLSCLFEFIQNQDPIEHLVVWSDSCAGQNKNFNLIAFYQYLILHQYCKTIDHKFPEVGHSYLDSDRDFGRIEKVLKKHEKISSPEEYRSHIKSASNSKTKVIDMTGKFYNIGGLVVGLSLYNNKRNDMNELVQFRDGIRWIRVNSFGHYLYKECLNENIPFKRINIAQTGAAPIDFELEKKIFEQLPIKKKKVDNLKEQMKFIDPQYHWFYDQIFNAPVNNDNNNETDGINKGNVSKQKPAGLKRKSTSPISSAAVKNLKSAKKPQQPKKQPKKQSKKPPKKQPKMQSKWTETLNS